MSAIGGKADIKATRETARDSTSEIGTANGLMGLVP